MDDADGKRADTLKRYAIMDTAPEAVFDRLVDEASFLTGAPIARVTMVDDDRQWFKAKTGSDHEGDPIAQSICAVAIRQDETFVVPDASIDDRFSALRGVTVDGIRFYAGVPLTVRDGSRVGTLCVIDNKARPALDQDERAALEALARRTVAAMEVRRDLIDSGDGDLHDPRWLDRARTLLDQAAAALTQIGATAALAHLETVIAMVAARGDHRDPQPAT